MRNKEDDKRSKIEIFPQLNVEDIKTEDRFLFHKLMEEADQYEKKLNADPSLDNIKEQPELFSSIVEELIRLNKWQEGFDDDSMDCSEETSDVSKMESQGEEDEELDAGSDAKSGDESEGELETSFDSEFAAEFGAEFAREFSSGFSGKLDGKSDAKPDAVENEKLDNAVNAYDLLSEEDRKALEIGKKKLAMRKRDKIVKILGTAAVVVFCFCAVGLSSEANREKIMNIWRTITEDGLHIQISSSTGSLTTLEDGAEKSAISKIRSQLDIEAPQIMYKPIGIKYMDYNVDMYGKVAFMMYEYKDTFMSVYMHQKVSNIERGQVFDGKVTDTFTTTINGGQTVEVNEIENPNNELLYVTGFKYNEAYYTISCIMSKEDFTKMLNNIYF